MIAFLHTAPGHVATFEALLRAAGGGAVPSRHAVDESLLAEARAAGGVTPAVAERVAGAVAALVADGATVVLCTCSTIGGAAESVPRADGSTVLRVDRPMAERAVALGRRIAVVAALDATLAPTGALLRDAARRAGRAIEIRDVLCADVWPHFECGNRPAYLAAVSAAAALAACGSDVVVLAQASMADVADGAAFAVPVLASPRLGVEAALRAYRSVRS